VLVGFRAAGKTTIGRELARLLRRPFLDLDREIERSTGRSVARIFASDGEPAFRRLEARALRDLRARPAAVIATGGGVIERAESRRIVCAAGLVVWIQVSEAELVRRLARSRRRPSLTGRAVSVEARDLLRRRRPWYRAVADRVVRCGDASPSELARRIATFVPRVRS